MARTWIPEMTTRRPRKGTVLSRAFVRPKREARVHVGIVRTWVNGEEKRTVQLHSAKKAEDVFSEKDLSQPPLGRLPTHCVVRLPFPPAPHPPEERPRRFLRWFGAPPGRRFPYICSLNLRRSFVSCRSVRFLCVRVRPERIVPSSPSRAPGRPPLR